MRAHFFVHINIQEGPRSLLLCTANKPVNIRPSYSASKDILGQSLTMRHFAQKTALLSKGSTLKNIKQNGEHPTLRTGGRSSKRRAQRDPGHPP